MLVHIHTCFSSYLDKAGFLQRSKQMPFNRVVRVLLLAQREWDSGHQSRTSGAKRDNGGSLGTGSNSCERASHTNTGRHRLMPRVCVPTRLVCVPLKYVSARSELACERVRLVTTPPHNTYLRGETLIVPADVGNLQRYLPVAGMTSRYLG